MVSALAFTAPAMAAPGRGGPSGGNRERGKFTPGGMASDGHHDWPHHDHEVECDHLLQHHPGRCGARLVLRHRDWWIKMVTTWCWNGIIMTSHSTSVTH